MQKVYVVLRQKKEPQELIQNVFYDSDERYGYNITEFLDRSSYKELDFADDMTQQEISQFVYDNYQMILMSIVMKAVRLSVDNRDITQVRLPMEYQMNELVRMADQDFDMLIVKL